MKKMTYLLGLLLIANSIFNAYGVEIEVEKSSMDTDEGVVIGGVRWATRNVDAPGTFVSSPEETGMFFQWRKMEGRRAPSNQHTDWEIITPSSDRLNYENDPCPEGWRLPSLMELEMLFNADNTWVTHNGVNGRLMGTAPNQIFLPAVGFLDFQGEHWWGDEHGVYMSSITAMDNDSEPFGVGVARFQQMDAPSSSNINDPITNIYAMTIFNWYSVRCVAKTSDIDNE